MPGTGNTAGYGVVELCAGAGGQALGLERAGFRHELAVGLDANACATLRANRPAWQVREGDVADPATWDPAAYAGVDLLAGGVPCPPFSIAGKQLGASDERDLFAWAVELAGRVRPRALMLENVRGLSAPRFAAYRQHVLDRLADFGYQADWRLLHAADFGVPQLRPRFVLVALRPEDAAHFHWPEARPHPGTVGDALADLMAAGGWRHAAAWAAGANDIAPTVVGGSKKHGGADLGPTRAKRAWLALGVDGKGIADAAPAPDAPHPLAAPPRLTLEMVARLQGWRDGQWQFTGGKTSRYRQIGNAFPPPVAEAVGAAIAAAFTGTAARREPRQVPGAPVHDPVYQALRQAPGYVAAARLREVAGSGLEQRLDHLARDFELDTKQTADGLSYRLGAFKAFTGQGDHHRHEFYATSRSKVS